MAWRVPNMWEGGECWIIGGGSSVPKQFDIPDSVILDVVEGRSTPSAYSPYLSAIHNKHVIGINVAYLLGNWVDMMFFGDAGFYLAHRQAISQFPNLKVGCCNGVEGYRAEGILPMGRDQKRFGISDHNMNICWNGNSGAAAISIAAHTGVKRIVLLGFDMNLQNNEQHWHRLYGKRPAYVPGGKTKPKSLPFDRHLRGFPDIAKDAKAKGIEIINASPTSAITVFPKVSVKELLQ